MCVYVLFAWNIEFLICLFGCLSCIKLCRGCDGFCDFCLICDACNCKWFLIGKTSFIMKVLGISVCCASCRCSECYILDCLKFVDICFS